MTMPAPTDQLADLLADLEPVGIDDLIAAADLQNRKDRKYLIAESDVPKLVSRLDRCCRILTIDRRNTFTYRSTYFDTADLDLYLDAAHRRPSRFKVRTRHYLDSDLCMLEVKTRHRRGHTVKHREVCNPVEEQALTDDGRRFVDSIQEAQPVADQLRPSLTTVYQRTTLLLDHDPARVTIDTNLRWRANGSELGIGPVVLVETKTTGRPCTFERILWQSGHRPTAISKYCTGLAALDPALPANKWNRVLRKHLGWYPRRG